MLKSIPEHPSHASSLPTSQQRENKSSRSYQYIGVIASLVLFIEYMAYAIFVSSKDQSYVSDNLERDITFRLITTLGLTIQYLLLICFFSKFRKANMCVSVVGIFLVVFSYVGWLVLVVDYSDPNHYIGFGIFVSAGICYWILILTYQNFNYFNEMENCVLLVLSAVFCIVYVAMYFMQHQYSWVFEHVAVIILNVAFALFFWIHNPDPQEAYEPGIHYMPVDNMPT